MPYFTKKAFPDFVVVIKQDIMNVYMAILCESFLINNFM